MTESPRTPELLRVAKHMVWFKPPEETLRDPVLFLNHVMTWGTVDDIRVARSCFDEDDFRDALRRAHPGIFDPRSWAYWHLVLGMDPAPPLPERRLLESGRTLGSNATDGAIARYQELARREKRTDGSVVDAFIAERRREAADE